MTSRNIKISSRALAKIQLHAAKYPHCGVNGLLLACKLEFNAEKVLDFVDAVPLFHQALQLTPMLEIALMRIDAFCASRDLYIAGYYEAAKYLRNDSEAPGLFTCRVADKVKENFGESVLVVLDNKKVPFKESLKFFDQSSDKKWKLRQSSNAVNYQNGAERMVQELIDKNVHKDLVDFDNHLDDLSLSWLNDDINQLILME